MILYSSKYRVESRNSGASSKFGDRGTSERTFRMAIDHIIGNRGGAISLAQKVGEFSEMDMVHLNSQVLQFGGFAHGRRVFGRAPKMPIATVCSPNFADFANP